MRYTVPLLVFITTCFGAGSAQKPTSTPDPAIEFLDNVIMQIKEEKAAAKAKGEVYRPTPSAEALKNLKEREEQDRYYKQRAAAVRRQETNVVGIGAQHVVAALIYGLITAAIAYGIASKNDPEHKKEHARFWGIAIFIVALIGQFLGANGAGNDGEDFEARTKASFIRH